MMRSKKDTSKFEDWIDAAIEALEDCILRAEKNGRTPEEILGIILNRVKMPFRNSKKSKTEL